MDDLIAFIRARLDEDEAAANAGARRVGMPWRAEPQPGTPGGLVIDELGLVGSTGGRYAAEHIARHDPARVLREVEALRHILFMANKFKTQDRAYLHLLLAAVWSDHADFRQEWAPDPDQLPPN